MLDASTRAEANLLTLVRSELQPTEFARLDDVVQSTLAPSSGSAGPGAKLRSLLQSTDCILPADSANERMIERALVIELCDVCAVPSLPFRCAVPFCGFWSDLLQMLGVALFICPLCVGVLRGMLVRRKTLKVFNLIPRRAVEVVDMIAIGDGAFVELPDLAMQHIYAPALVCNSRRVVVPCREPFGVGVASELDAVEDDNLNSSHKLRLTP